MTESMKNAINKSTTIITELGNSFYVKNSILDGKITIYAKAQGKKIEGFETIFDQCKRLQVLQGQLSLMSLLSFASFVSWLNDRGSRDECPICRIIFS